MKNNETICNINNLKVTNLSKSYKKRQVVKDVSLELNSGEIIGLLGPNGAGKTTYFYMILGLVACDKGSITLNENDITALPVHERAKLGISYLPQEPSIFRKLSVKDNIKAILEVRKDLNNDQKEQYLLELLEEFHLTHIVDIPGISLSGGERRRVEIARALATNPKFILLDEPFAGVDPISIGEIKKIITHLTNKGIGILITDHNVRDTLDICKRAYIVSSGIVIANGNATEILNNEEVRKVYLGEEFYI